MAPLRYAANFDIWQHRNQARKQWWRPSFSHSRRSLKSLSSRFRHDKQDWKCFPCRFEARRSRVAKCRFVNINVMGYSPSIKSTFRNLTLVGHDFELIFSHFVAWAGKGRTDGGRTPAPSAGSALAHMDACARAGLGLLRRRGFCLKADGMEEEEEKE